MEEGIVKNSCDIIYIKKELNIIDLKLHKINNPFKYVDETIVVRTTIRGFVVLGRICYSDIVFEGGRHRNEYSIEYYEYMCDDNIEHRHFKVYEEDIVLFENKNFLRKLSKLLGKRVNGYMFRK